MLVLVDRWGNEVRLLRMVTTERILLSAILGALAGVAFADESVTIVLADPATESVRDQNWWRLVLERDRTFSLDATSRCATEGKVPVFAAWQNSDLQLMRAYKCRRREDPDYKAAQERGAPMFSVPSATLTQALAKCASLGEEAEETGLNMWTFYTCVPSSPPAENRLPR